MTWPTTAPHSPAWLLPLQQTIALSEAELTEQRRLERRRINRESKRRSREGQRLMTRTEALELGRLLRRSRRPYFRTHPGNPQQKRGAGGRFRSGAATAAGTRKA